MTHYRTKELTKIEMRTVQEAVQSGFTFAGDAHFKTAMQGVRTIKALVGRNILWTNREGDAIVDYRPTQLARDIVRYGSLESALA
jgi:hypothetical protein